MKLLVRDGWLIHVLLLINKEKRAGRTACQQYVDTHPREIIDARATLVHPTCVRCLGAMDCDCDKVRVDIGGAPRSMLIDGHEPACNVVVGQDAIDERYEDIINNCTARGQHLQDVDDDGFCQACGYQDTP